MEKITQVFCYTILAMVACTTLAESKKVHYSHWNRANPMFRLDNTDHVVDVNTGNLPWEYDQVNIICPVSRGGNRYPERHVIYSVSREEYESCRITNPKPTVVAVCSKPHQLLYFTITFRSFTPTPGGLEFHPGQDYYFISTSSREDLHRRVGGGCATHNMKMIFRVAENGAVSTHLNEIVQEVETMSASNSLEETTTKEPMKRFNSRDPNTRRDYGKYVTYRVSEIFKNDVDSIDIKIDTQSSPMHLPLSDEVYPQLNGGGNFQSSFWMLLVPSLLYLIL